MQTELSEINRLLLLGILKATCVYVNTADHKGWTQAGALCWQIAYHPHECLIDIPSLYCESVRASSLQLFLVESQYANWGGSKYITSEGSLVREKNYYYLVISDNTLKNL